MFLQYHASYPKFVRSSSSSYSFAHACMAQTSFYQTSKHFCLQLAFSFYLGFLSQPFTKHMTAGEGGEHFFNSSLPLSPASQTLKHQPGDYCRELNSAHCQQPDSNQQPLVSERKSLTIKLRALQVFADFSLSSIFSYYFTLYFLRHSLAKLPPTSTFNLICQQLSSVFSIWPVNILSRDSIAVYS